MFVIVSVFTFLFPIFSILFSFIGLIFDRKHRVIYSVLLSLSLATISYIYISPYTDDLYRHHIVVASYSDMSFKEFLLQLVTDMEKIPLIFSYIVSKINNVNLLQFIVTFLSYFNIFYLINKSVKSDSSLLKYSVIMLYTFFSFSYLSIISNLWFMLASTFFCIGIYKEHVENKRKSALAFYIFAFFTHSSILFPIFMLFMFKFFKYKNNFKTFLVLILIFTYMGVILKYLSTNYNVGIFNLLYEYYVPYFENTSFIEDMHPLKLMIIYLIKLIPYLLVYIFNKELHDNYMNRISMFFSMIVIILYSFSSFSVRFIPVAQLVGINLLSESFDQLKNGKRYNMFFTLSIVAVMCVWVLFNFWQIRNFNFYNIDDLFYRGIFSIIGSRF